MKNSEILDKLFLKNITYPPLILHYILKYIKIDTEVLNVEVAPRFQGQISRSSHVFVPSYSQLKLSECLCTTSRVGKN